jgi:hypothetical protein
MENIIIALSSTLAAVFVILVIVSVKALRLRKKMKTLLVAYSKIELFIASQKDKESDNDVHKENFEDFWNIYNKKIGRDKCYKQFCKLPVTILPVIIDNVKKYVATIKDKQRQKQPATYLNNRSRENVIYSNEPDYEKIPDFHKQMSIDVQPIKDFFSKKY